MSEKDRSRLYIGDTRAFPPRELAIKKLPGHDVCMHVGTCGGIFFSALQRLRDFVRDIKMQDLAEGTRLDSVLSLFAVQSSEELNWAVDGCLG